MFYYNNNYQMQEKTSFKPSSIISVQSRPSNFSNCRSLGRPSYQMKQHSLGKKASLVYVMSIQSERRSDLYDKLLQSDKKPKNRISNIINGTSYEQQNNQLLYNQRNSQQNNNQDQIQIQHECKCFDGCFQGSCPCYQAKNQMCIPDQCCKQCILIKHQLFKLLYQQQYQKQNLQINNHQNGTSYMNMQYEQNETQFSCNCKNTECLKSYCKCFQQGGFCSDKCKCEYCKNKSQSQERTQALQAIKNNGQVLFCTCKKTKCNKKYCSCYAAGQKCSKLCSCQSCTNCIKTSMDVQQMQCCLGQQNYDNVQMPVQMDFEPFTFS